MTTKIALSPTKGRMRFWKTAVGVFGLASAGVFADVALRDQGLDTALLIAAIPAAFAGLSALALRSVVAPVRFPTGVLNSILPAFHPRTTMGFTPGRLSLAGNVETDGHTFTHEDQDDWKSPSPTGFDQVFDRGSGLETIDGFCREIEGDAYGSGSFHD